MNGFPLLLVGSVLAVILATWPAAARDPACWVIAPSPEASMDMDMPAPALTTPQDISGIIQAM